ncbi:unnamed protein product [Nesidiocoris tenuis]|uniref:Uncharacterized protein n=1 Tax=Nesidiocoris tenuis TaxID=355587 RepID=A0A6H5FYG3_9HEMI|nr:unnamed protein product [Nesidiocoris tenuis]
MFCMEHLPLTYDALDLREKDKRKKKREKADLSSRKPTTENQQKGCFHYDNRLRLTTMPSLTYLYCGWYEMSSRAPSVIFERRLIISADCCRHWKTRTRDMNSSL